MVTDGMEVDGNGHVYLTDLEHNAVAVRDRDGRVRTLVKDERLNWPDTFAWGPDGWLYVTTSQIHLTPRFNQGQDLRTQPNYVFKIKVK